MSRALLDFDAQLLPGESLEFVHVAELLELLLPTQRILFELGPVAIRRPHQVAWHPISKCAVSRTYQIYGVLCRPSRLMETRAALGVGFLGPAGTRGDLWFGRSSVADTFPGGEGSRVSELLIGRETELHGKHSIVTDLWKASFGFKVEG